MQKGRRIAAILVALITFLAACEPVQGGLGDNDSNGHKKEWGFFFCNTTVRLVPQKTILPGTGGQEEGIVASALSVCDRPPSKHIVTVNLERLIERSGQWVSRTDWLGLSGGGSQVCPEIPTKRGRECKRVKDGCISGKWRVTISVEWAGADPQGQPRSGTFEVAEKPVRDIKCSGPGG